VCLYPKRAIIFGWREYVGNVVLDIAGPKGVSANFYFAGPSNLR
jgi:hypothetical protein